MIDPHLFVVLGATGDLLQRKLLPALHARLGDSRCHLVGVASGDLGDDGFRTLVGDALVAAGVPAAEATAWAGAHVSYHRVGRDEPYRDLAARLAALDREHDAGGNRVLYLAMPPAAFGPAITRLGEAGLNRSEGWTRLVVEKPFGTDLASAATLNRVVHEHFTEPQVFRIDHYLGKETVQNLLVFRFTNPIFESAWNRDRVERVEITVAEAVAVGDRGSYYDAVGVVRDMVQSHLTQVLSLVAMEAPSRFAPDAIRDEKVKMLRSARPLAADDFVMGQYRGGRVAGVPVPSYLDTPDVAPDSAMPTFAAVRLWIDNWRWQGVPFYLRTGKALARRVTEVAVSFRRPPVCLIHGVLDDCAGAADVLRLTLQPEEGFSLEIDVKEPGDSTRLRPVHLRFSYDEEFGRIPDAYETLLDDIVIGDQTLFVRHDETEEAWRLFTPLLESTTPPEPYPAGSWGPEAARVLLPPDRDHWTTGG